MFPRLLTRGFAAAGSTALAVGLLSGVSQAMPDPADAGNLIVMTHPTADPFAVPAELDGRAVAQAARSWEQNVVYLLADGHLLTSVREDQTSLVLPEELEDETFTSVDASPTAFGALTTAGEAKIWGTGLQREFTPEQGSDLVQLSMGAGHVVALKSDGTVVAWGTDGYGQATVPDDLTDVVDVAAASESSFAVRADGTVVAWGRDNQGSISDMPTINVVDIAGRDSGGLALMNDGSVMSWGFYATKGRGTMYNAVPASLDGKTVTQIDADSNSNVAIDSEGNIVVWGNEYSVPSEVPADLDGRTISHVSISSNYGFLIQRAVYELSAPSVTGDSTVGETLTGTPATFTGGGDLTNQWWADDVAIDGATGTTLELTEDLIGASITFETTSTIGDDVVTSVSEPVGPVVSAITPVEFSDIEGIHFQSEIEWLSTQGITTGYDNGDGTFSYAPSAQVLREQMAAFLYRFEHAGGNPDPVEGASEFVDVPATHVFKAHIAWLASTGITTGYDNGDGTRSYAPAAPVLREQMAAFLYRLAGSPEWEAPAVSPFTDLSTSHVFYDEITWLADTQITTGYDNGNGTKSFQGSAPVLREQMAAFLFRFNNLDLED